LAGLARRISAAPDLWTEAIGDIALVGSLKNKGRPSARKFLSIQISK
jgi:hypothetical protein